MAARATTDVPRLFVNTDDDEVLSDLVHVCALGKQVKLCVGDVTVMMSPHQAQNFAFRLATAYARAGRLTRRACNYTIDPKETVR